MYVLTLIFWRFSMAHQVREKTDALDAAGNTTAAVGKGFAIGSAALVSLALYGAFVTRLTDQEGTNMNGGVNILQPLTFSFLVIGAMLPYWCARTDMIYIFSRLGLIVCWDCIFSPVGRVGASLSV